MIDLVGLFSVIGSLITLAFVGLIIWRGRRTNLASEEDLDSDDDSVRRRPVRGVPVPRPGSSGDAPFRKVRNRRPIRGAVRSTGGGRGRDGDEDDEFSHPPEFVSNARDEDGPSDGDSGADSGEEDEDDGESNVPEGKIGAKKRRKLEMKAEKRMARERELQEREERKQRQAMLDEEKRKKDEAEREEERKREEEEKRIREEKERKEHEEYLKMKEAFEIEEEGFDQDTDESEQSNKLAAFIQFIKNEKVVLLEDLAGTFQMKTQDAINRLNLLLEDQQLTGVIDDRGKFIYITQEELEEIAKFIRRRGRVAISELVENSNQLINMKA
ncbi:DDRGK domain-containing protein 1-like [Panonychus citri]|uniref:DDRGK domain-containing protein 1-like n=1 Tax=Panonychus citri TaxID=50023 RepID=UPI0023079D53|nr:DDRGK domain-containing protein 1-like [Panonychus citri]XP_053203839.1 DDRGK domain-containing protein 1-like [Panonychus citri]